MNMLACIGTYPRNPGFPEETRFQEQRQPKREMNDHLQVLCVRADKKQTLLVEVVFEWLKYVVTMKAPAQAICKRTKKRYILTNNTSADNYILLKLI